MKLSKNNTNVINSSNNNTNNNFTRNTNNVISNAQLLQQLLQGTMPQQQPAVSDSSLRRKFSNIPNGKISENTISYAKHQQKIANNFAKVGYYDHYGTFHKASKKIRPVSGVINIKPPTNPNNLSIVDRIIEINTKDDTDTKQKHKLQDITTSNIPKRSYSAGKIRPQSNLGTSNIKINNATVMAKKLEDMYNSNIIGTLDTIITPVK